MELQVGSKRTKSDELTQVSDSGERAQLTTLQLQVRRESYGAKEYWHTLRKSSPLPSGAGGLNFSSGQCHLSKR
ncbi:hypothetical protein CU280_08955 [Yersinia mollaretii]|nr:hypothetical protein CU280_08955 [Yersinia mollaretii]